MTKNIADDMLYQTRAGFALVDTKDAILVVKEDEQ